MSLFALIAVAFYCVFSLFLGTRMLLLARRTRELPELLIGLAFMSGGMIGYPFSIAAGLFQAASKLEAAALAHAAGQTGMALAAFFMLLSWRFIFATTGRGKLAFVLVWTVLMVATLVTMIRTTVPGDVSYMTSLNFYLLMTAQGGCYALLGWASLQHGRMLKKRCAIGLADPVIANRIFVWGLANVAIFVSYAYAVVAGILVGFGLPNIHHPSVVVGCGLTSALFVWLSFFPPKAYLDRIGANAVAQEA